MDFIDEIKDNVKSMEDMINSSKEIEKNVEEQLDLKEESKNETLKEYVTNNLPNVNIDLENNYTSNKMLLLKELSNDATSQEELKKFNIACEKMEKEQKEKREEAKKIAKEIIKLQENKLKEITPEDDNLNELNEKIDEYINKKTLLNEKIEELQEIQTQNNNLDGQDEIDNLQEEIEKIDEKLKEFKEFFIVLKKLKTNLSKQKENFKNVFSKANIDFEEEIKTQNKGQGNYNNYNNRNNYNNNNNDRNNRYQNYNNRNETDKNGENLGNDEKTKDDQNKENKYNKDNNNFTRNSNNNTQGYNQNEHQGEQNTNENTNVYKEEIEEDNKLPTITEEQKKQNALNEIESFAKTGNFKFDKLYGALELVKPSDISIFTKIKLKMAINKNQDNLKKDAKFIDKEAFGKIVGLEKEELDDIFGEKEEDILKFSKKIDVGDIKSLENVINKFYEKVEAGEVSKADIEDFDNISKYIKSGIINTKAKELSSIFSSSTKSKSHFLLSYIIKKGDKTIERITSGKKESANFKEELKDKVNDTKDLDDNFRDIETKLDKAIGSNTKSKYEKTK